MSTAAVRVFGLVKRFGEVVAVDLGVEQGTVQGLLGPDAYRQPYRAQLSTERKRGR